MQLLHGAQPGNVYWFVGSSATIGDYSTMIGHIIAYASITFNSYSTLSGRAIAGAAITFASGSTVKLAIQTGVVPTAAPTAAPSTALSATSTPSAQPIIAPSINFRGCTGFVLEAESTITFGGAHTSVTGDIGISPGTSITGDYGQSTYGVTHINDAKAATCSADMKAILAEGAAQPCMNIAAELGECMHLFYHDNNN